ncbi:glycosyltransferase [Modicisalibacter tunisiensis]|uniref:Glycosyltransferase n=1 Tax=Modicisalibacter tunisiensis TaxID=390637 RepID=A0ABS7WUT1_9GAMM|nr:glycosyltransferase [Modicisalibacter tunisiensis]MBZ9566130.1 glycosyltransferase [Modicisalibacter tunisiensis]
MRIIVDMQGAQAQSRKRGIGRYTLALIRALIRQGGDHEIILVFNELFEESIKDLWPEFQSWLGIERLHVWSVPAPVRKIDGENESRWKAAEQLYENYLGSLKPDFVLVTSLFEGLGDDAVTSIKAWRRDYPVAIVLFDLIPLIHRSPYLDNPAHARWYDEKVLHLQRADLLLAISESTRREGLSHFDFPDSGIVNISSAFDEGFQPITISTERRHVLRVHYGLPKPFIMYTGGIDHRKNLEGLIRAFAKLQVDFREKFQLAIVCAVHDPERERLQALARRHGLESDALVLTGFVPEQDLLELYNLCEAFVFPSWHEGFGLPALEAMACGAPVIASNTTSLPEVVGWDEALFDPHDDDAIAEKLHRVLGDSEFRQQLREHGLKQAARFSWDGSARIALQAMVDHVDNSSQDEPSGVDIDSRPKLALVSPLPPERSGISDYSAELLPVLAEHYKIDVFVDQSEVKDDWVHRNCHVRPASELREIAGDYDRVLYQFGNSAFHQHMFELLDDVPGVVVLHDFFLSGVIAHREWFFGLTNSWLDALYESHGYPAVLERCRQSDTADVVWRYPCNLPVLQRAHGVIVHSANSCRLARQWYGEAAGRDWSHIPLLRRPASGDSQRRYQARKELGIEEDALVVCSFGFLGATKLNHRLLDAWLDSALAKDTHALLIFVGDSGPDEYGARLKRRIRESAQEGRIRITGWADDLDYHRYLAAADIGVQLRTRSRGETSAAVLDCMNHGLATIVNANGSMADLSDSVVFKLPDAFSDRQLGDALECLYRDPDWRMSLGRAAAAEIHAAHAPAHCANLYHQAIEASYRRINNTGEGVAESLARQPHVAAYDDAQRCQLAASIDFNFPEAPRQPQLLLDVTGLIADGDTPRPLTARLLDHWLTEIPQGYRLEPVYRNDAGEWCYARHFALKRLGVAPELLRDDPVGPHRGDLWMGLEVPAESLDDDDSHYRHLRYRGVHVSLFTAEEIAGSLDRWFNGITEALPAMMPDRDTPLLLVDVSELVRHDIGTGIQRVVRNILAQWRDHPPAGYRPMPVYARTDSPGYRHARGFMLKRLGLPATLLPDDPVNPLPGDRFLGLDLQPAVVSRQRELYRAWRESGIRTEFVVYDLLCVRYPQFFREGGRETFQRWLDVVGESDGLIAISRAVAGQLRKWLDERESQAGEPCHQPRVDWFHLGGDLEAHEIAASSPVSPMMDALDLSRPTFLMVGTLEPRKAHGQVLEAFDRLWQDGRNINLVIVGKPGWHVESLVDTLNDHEQRGHRLFWLADCGDATLRWLYQHSSCLIAASHDEGFGLPLIEAARHHLPILARDIPVFREVAGEHAGYFSASDAGEVAEALCDWLEAHAQGRHVRSDAMKWQSWEASAAQLAERLLAPTDITPSKHARTDSLV